MSRLALLFACFGCATATVAGAPRSEPALDAFRLLFEQGIVHGDTVAIAKAVAPQLIFHERGDVFPFRDRN